MKFVTSKETLVAMAKAASYIVEDVLIECRPDGWSMKAVDAANVACVTIHIPKSAFEFYELPGEFDDVACQMAIDLLRFEDKLKSFDNGDPVALEVDDGELIVKSGPLKYKLSLLDPSAIRNPSRIPTLDLPVKVVLDTAEYLKAVKGLTKLADTVWFGIEVDEDNNESFQMEAKGDIDSARMKKPVDTLKGYKPGKASSRISSGYLQDIAKSVKGSDEVELELGVDYPMILKAKVQDVEAEYLVAPRIE